MGMMNQTCDFCGNPLTEAQIRKKARFCSGGHRQKWWAQKRRESIKKTAILGLERAHYKIEALEKEIEAIKAHQGQIARDFHTMFTGLDLIFDILGFPEEETE
jgi:hypothetical protein